MKISKKVWKLGGSVGISLPSIWTKENNVKHKDSVTLDIKKEKIIVTKKEDSKK